MQRSRNIFNLMSDISQQLDDDHSLSALAKKVGKSPFHLHREFQRLAGETPRQYTHRLPLEQAAADLATSTDSVLCIALNAGFGGH